MVIKEREDSFGKDNGLLRPHHFFIIDKSIPQFTELEKESKQGFHVIRYDNRDVGKTITYEYGHPEYTFEDLAQDAIHVLTAYKVDEAHIVGIFWERLCL